jgi:hypothetical protein
VSESDQAKTGASDEENTEEESTPKRKKREKGQGRRISLPETLRRENVFIEPTDSTEGCVVIGEEVTEVIKTISTRGICGSTMHQRIGWFCLTTGKVGIGLVPAKC